LKGFRPDLAVPAGLE